MAALERSLRMLTRTSLRRAPGWLLLGLVLIGLVGIPVPERKRVAGEAPFPCQDHPCGCATAESCWRQCCCFSNSEKLVWAEQHGVTPPEFVVRAARAEAAERSLCASSAGDTCHSPARSGDSPRAGAGSPSCCSTASAAAAKEITEDEIAEAAEASSPVVLLDAYQRCRGLASVFKHLVENWVPEAAPRIATVSPILYRLSAVDASPVDRADAPEPPVPWV